MPVSENMAPLCGLLSVTGLRDKLAQARAHHSASTRVTGAAAPPEGLLSITGLLEKERALERACTQPAHAGDRDDSSREWAPGRHWVAGLAQARAKPAAGMPVSEKDGSPH